MQWRNQFKFKSNRQREPLTQTFLRTINYSTHLNRLQLSLLVIISSPSRRLLKASEVHLSFSNRRNQRKVTSKSGIQLKPQKLKPSEKTGKATSQIKLQLLVIQQEQDRQPTP